MSYVSYVSDVICLVCHTDIEHHLGWLDHTDLGCTKEMLSIQRGLHPISWAIATITVLHAARGREGATGQMGLTHVQCGSKIRHETLRVTWELVELTVSLNRTAPFNSVMDFPAAENRAQCGLLQC